MVLTVYSFPAKSTQKVARTLNFCLDRAGIKSNGYMGVFNPEVFKNSRYKFIYYVVEWVLTNDEIDFINTLPKPVIPASNFVKFLSRNYRFPAVLHEVPIDFINARVKNTNKKFDFFGITYSLVRKIPYLMIKFANRTKHKGIILGDQVICNHINNPNVKCLPFGVQTEDDLKTYYANSKVYLFLSGNEGFGVPPLEASYMGRPVISLPIMPYLEWHPRDRFTVPSKWLKMAGIYQHGSLHPVLIPKDQNAEEEILKFVEDMIADPTPDNNTYKAFEKAKELSMCNEYYKIAEILKAYGVK